MSDTQKPFPYSRGRSLTKKTKNKLSEALRGRKPWNYGIKTGIVPHNKGKRWDAELHKIVTPTEPTEQ